MVGELIVAGLCIFLLIYWSIKRKVDGEIIFRIIEIIFRIGIIVLSGGESSGGGFSGGGGKSGGGGSSGDW